ncbi:hypothetical protein GCM10008018_09840 [Paenibacillus marchantiophytorum]|uniref:Uncharacterized protein n=1 Tax=Paenibacillus marchantiophytorum TaxID=1619310 RepID=A0ABQ2BQ85_9BACL|nr:hypothetical protein GCM10008018_09840 [Paenibacillus marchantiophytorum]
MKRKGGSYEEYDKVQGNWDYGGHPFYMPLHLGFILFPEHRVIGQ